MDMRADEEKKLENNPDFTIGDVTTVNLTMIKGGVQDNVVPPLIDVGFDIRIALDLDHKELYSKVRLDNLSLKDLLTHIITLVRTMVQGSWRRN